MAIIIVVVIVVFYLPSNEKIVDNENNQVSKNHIPNKKPIIEDKKTVYSFAQNEKNRLSKEQRVAAQERYFNLGEGETETKEDSNPFPNPTTTSNTVVADSDPFAEYVKQRNATTSTTNTQSQNNSTVPHNQYGTKDMWSVTPTNQTTPGSQTPTNTFQNEGAKSSEPVVVAQSKKDLFERGSKARSKNSNFSASIRGTQDLKAGQILRFQTDEEFFINGQKIPKNTALFGVLSLSKYRAEIFIENANINGKIVAVNLSVYGNDGIKGIPVFTDEPVRDAKDKTVNEAARHTTGSGIIGTATSILSGVASSKAKDPVVKFIDNQKVILVQDKTR
ncbi:conjugative transposon protein TraM [Myroides injenensis]|uniref:conjugative transposon protein TraM n=1 Tax=Myroides injenensis TaxID=1183151 RepID=UPI002270F465|nr:conjugative transposon protein TraM [Myroides injenensis]